MIMVKRNRLCDFPSSADRNIKSGWCKAGLYPSNPDRVLNHVHKPQCEAFTSQIANTNAELASPHDVMRTPVTWENLL